MTARALPRAIPTSLPPLSRLLVSVALLLAAWEQRRNSRSALIRLDDHILRDIGLTPDQAQSEGTKPFWRD